MVTYTSSSLYQSPLKPRINIYAFGDATYTTPLYSYNPFTDVGSTSKPIALSFDSQTTNAGTFSLELENSTNALDADLYMKGNRVVIDCSKDGTTWQSAFKGLVRGTEQNVFGQSGKNLTLNGYSYLIRLNERIINTLKESSVDNTGQYIRTDSSMFTNNLINNLLTSNGVYVYGGNADANPTVLKTDDIVGSPLTDWIARLDGALVPLSEAIQSILENSGGVASVDFATDELEIYSPDAVSAATGTFLITNAMNQNADDADKTMYPLEPYKYNINYDNSDSGSRLIASIGSNSCVPAAVTDPIMNTYTSADPMFVGSSQTSLACQFEATGSPMTGLRLGVVAHGNMSTATQSTVKIFGPSQSGGEIIHAEGWVEYIYNVGPQVGTITVYKDGIPATPYPNTGAGADIQFVLGQQAGVSGPSVSGGSIYIMALVHTQTTQSATNQIKWIVQDPSGFHDSSTNSFNTYANTQKTSAATANWDVPNYYRFDFAGPSAPADVPCGGLPAVADADPVFAIGHDRNATNKIGMRERVMSSIPTSVKTSQTMIDYLSNQLYYSVKPRFTFDYPSVSVPNKMPKAGDIVFHVDSKLNVGLRSTPAQTGVITEVRYDFSQDNEEVLGLTRMGVTTVGFRRGYY